jgi:hypothetical protein
MLEKSAFLAKLFLRALCASARVSGQRDFGCGFPRCAFAFGLGLLVTARRFEKRRWRSALQDLAALRKRPLNAPASWSAEREFRFGHKRGPEPSFIQRPECQGNGKKSFQNDAPAHHSRDKHSSGTSPLFLFPSLSSFRLRLAALGLCSAISRIHSFLTKLFHHEEHEGHEVMNMTDCTIFLRDLRVLRGENWVAAGRAGTLRDHLHSISSLGFGGLGSPLTMRVIPSLIRFKPKFCSSPS